MDVHARWRASPILESARFLFDTYREWQKDHPALLAAGLSYFALFSIAPVLIIVTAILGRIWAHDNVQHAIIEKLVSLTGPDTAHSVADWLSLTSRQGKGSATFFSFIVLYLTAARIFAQLRSAMDIIWELPIREEGIFKTFLRSTAKNLAMVLGLVCFMLLFLLSDAAMGVFARFAVTYMTEFKHLHVWYAAHLAVPFVLFTLLFAAVYKFLPDTPVSWSDVWLGALLTSLLFAIGRALMTLYFRFESFKSLYGTAGSVIVIMVWIYFAAQIFFFGAEITWLYARRYGSRRSTENPA